MSIETDFRAAVLAHGPAAALIGGSRICINIAPQGWAVPYIAYAVQHQRDPLLTGAVAGDVATITAQCWGRIAAQAAELADAVEAAMGAAWAPVVGRETAQDDQTGLHAEILSITWVTG